MSDSVNLTNVIPDSDLESIKARMRKEEMTGHSNPALRSKILSGKSNIINQHLPIVN